MAGNFVQASVKAPQGGDLVIGSGLVLYLSTSDGRYILDVPSGTGSPEGVFTAPVGTLYRRLDGGAGTTLYVKESGTGNTGWVGK